MAATSESTTDTSRNTRNQPPSNTPPSMVFTEYIEHNNAICPRCFARQRTLKLVAVPARTAEVHGDHLQMTEVKDAETGSDSVLYETSEATDAVNHTYPPRVSQSTASLEEVDVPTSWKRACPEPTVYCTECGAVDDDGDRATLSKDELIEHAKSVSRRLQEQEIEHDPALLVAVAKALKAKPAVQAKDEHILTHATRAAVEKRRHGRTRQMQIDESVNQIQVAGPSETSWLPAH